MSASEAQGHDGQNKEECFIIKVAAGEGSTSKSSIPPGCEDHIGYIGDSNTLLTSRIIEELQHKLNSSKTSFRVVQVTSMPASPGTSHQEISVIPCEVETKTETLSRSSPNLNSTFPSDVEEKAEIKKLSESSHQETLIVPCDLETKTEIEHFTPVADDTLNLTSYSCFWTRPPTLLLINLHSELSGLFCDPHYKKKTVWEMLARKMREKGHHYTWCQVESKWKAMTKKFRDAVDHNEKHGHVSMHVCSYFSELADVYRYKPDVVEKTLSQLDNGGVKLGVGGKYRPVKRSVEDVDADEDVVVELPKKKKFSAVLSGQLINSTESSPEKNSELFRFLRGLHNDKKRQDSANMAKIEIMHKEKMTLFNSFLEIFRDFAKKGK